MFLIISIARTTYTMREQKTCVLFGYSAMMLPTSPPWPRLCALGLQATFCSATAAKRGRRCGQTSRRGGCSGSHPRAWSQPSPSYQSRHLLISCSFVWLIKDCESRTASCSAPILVLSLSPFTLTVPRCWCLTGTQIFLTAHLLIFAILTKTMWTMAA